MAPTIRSLRYTLVILATPLVIPPVWAHAHLMYQYPAASARVTAAPQAITLNFSEGVGTGLSDVKITGLKNENIKTLPIKRNEQDQRQLIVPLAGSLKPGTYTVDWHVVSVDGRKTEGHYTFSVK